MPWLLIPGCPWMLSLVLLFCRLFDSVMGVIFVSFANDRLCHFQRHHQQQHVALSR